MSGKFTEIREVEIVNLTCNAQRRVYNIVSK